MVYSIIIDIIDSQYTIYFSKIRNLAFTGRRYPFIIIRGELRSIRSIILGESPYPHPLGRHRSSILWEPWAMGSMHDLENDRGIFGV